MVELVEVEALRLEALERPLELCAAPSASRILVFEARKIWLRSRA